MFPYLAAKSGLPALVTNPSGTGTNDVFVNNSIQIISKEQIISSTNQIESSVRQDLSNERENSTPNPIPKHKSLLLINSN